MEHEINKKTDLDFDFMSKTTTTDNIKSRFNFEKFVNVHKNALIATGLALAVGLTSVGGYEAYQANINKKIANAETVIQSSNQHKITDFINHEKISNEKVYIENQLLLNKYGEFKELVEMLNKQSEVFQYQNQNKNLYNKISQSLNEDLMNINKLFTIDTSSRNAKISEYLDTNDIDVAKKWNNAILTNQFVHIGNMIDLNNNIKGSVENLQQVKNDIVQHVQERIKNSDFDLNAAQNKFSQDIKGQTSSQLNELTQAQKDLAELKNQQVQTEDEDGNPVVVSSDPNAQNIITNKDITDAQNALGSYQDAAIYQVSNDRNKVEQLIAEAKQQSNQNNNQQQPQNVIVNQNQPQVVVVHDRGPSFLDYYLMYSWMNATPSTTVYHTTTVYNNRTPNVNYKPINIPKNNMYDMNNNNSYLNKQLSKPTFAYANGNGNGNFGKPNDALQKIQKSKVNISEIRNKIAATKTKIETAKTVKMNEVSKLSAAKTNKYDSSINKSNKSSFSSSKSTSSFRSSGGFGSSR